MIEAFSLKMHTPIGSTEVHQLGTVERRTSRGNRDKLREWEITIYQAYGIAIDFYKYFKANPS